ncbi:MAG TPA: ABC transporter permease [Acidimicrobiales bacterium]
MTDLVDPDLTGGDGTDPVAHLEPDRFSLSPVLEVSERTSPLRRLKHLWEFRELLVNLTRKELKVKYKNSILGFVWSLLNPLLYLLIFGVVFGVILGSQVQDYAIFMLSGLLAWNFFSAGLGGGCGAIVDNSSLVTKVWFPRETLVLASVGAALVHFFLQSTVLLAAMVIVGREPSFKFLPALPLAMVDLVILTAALAIALSAINVYLRDTQHLLELVLLAWFWGTAIVYPYFTIVTRFGAGREWMASLNPLLPIVLTFQRVLYNPTEAEQTAVKVIPGVKASPAARGTVSPTTIPLHARVLPNHDLNWYVTRLGLVGIMSVVLLYFALVLFSRLEGNFAEEI